MKKLTMLLFTFFVLSGIATAQKRTWEISLSNGMVIPRGTFEMMINDSVCVLSNGMQTWYPVSQFIRLESEKRHSQTMKMTLGGILLGGGVGFMSSHIINSGDENTSDDKALFTLLGAGIGGLTGYAIGASSSNSDSYNLISRDNTEKATVIEYIMLEEGTLTAQSLKKSPNSPYSYTSRDNGTNYPLYEEGEFIFGLNAGFASPAGDFSKQSSGGLNGYTIGADLLYHIINSASGKTETDWLTSFSVAVNEYRGSSALGDWVTMWPMTGVRLAYNLRERAQLFATLQGGVLVGSSPEISYIGNDGGVYRESATAAALAYRVGFGFCLSHRYFLQVHYMTGEPEYSIASYKFKQSTALMNLSAGIFF